MFYPRRRQHARSCSSRSSESARLERFFTKVNGEYLVTKSVRDCCIFARQNLTKDPPFTRLDLVSCRNVMIYLGPVLQRRVMGIFHYALRPNGYLLLGSSETVGSSLDQFGIVDRKHRIYRKKPGSVRIVGDFERAAHRDRPVRVRMNEEVPSPTGLFHEADRVLLSRYAPAGVLINENMEIVQFRGRTSAFLEPAPGSASLNLLKMAREGLLVELRATIHSARKTDSAARREGIHVKNNGGTITVNIEVIPFVAGNKERFQLVIFEEVSQPIEKSAAPKRWLGKKSKASKGESDGGSQLSRLKRELEATREYLQSIIEEQETMNEELRSANEETQSSNEELQSTNEELETAKEELQSTNEELTTLNEELENRNQELNVVNSDLINLLTAVDIPHPHARQRTAHPPLQSRRAADLESHPFRPRALDQ
ncbi:MAG TPA: CheR family methyltransferase [Thermoanaerobaculia bacterium]|nr:CheR family methyltransferase [Thermoanaerobaculia bacterium]